MSTNPEAEATPLLEPRDGVPQVVATQEALDATVRTLAAGTGPVAVDAERASGYRYGQRAYLVQLRRAGSGSALIDPVACPDLSALAAALADAEMVLHAANQDLPCLAELGFVPATLFDTELAGRLLGYAKVGLGSMVESLLGYALEKGHSAADWSTRPLPREWLRYAALDVELLIELRDVLLDELERAGKLTWAREEFAAVLATPPREPRSDPWRRTSGIHRVRSRRGLATVRELWWARDGIARDRDIAPGRVLSDKAIVEAALAMPAGARELGGIAAFTTRAARRYTNAWIDAISRARHLPDGDLPEQSTPGEGPPPANRWAERDPRAAERLAACRGVITGLAEAHQLPAENLVAPEAIRRIAWTPPAPATTGDVAGALRALGARSWQVDLLAHPLAEELSRFEDDGANA